MPAQGVILVTESFLDYVLAASAHRQIAQAHGFSMCHPVLVPPARVSSLERLLTCYGLRAIPFEAITEERELERSSHALRSLFPNGAAPLTVPRGAPPPMLATALFTSLTCGRPMMFGNAAGHDRLQVEAAPASESGRWVLAAPTPLAVFGAHFAACTDRQFAILPPGEGLDGRLRRGGWSSVILVDERRAFTKRFLGDLTGWVGESEDAFPPAILTGYSPSQVSAVVCRLLVHRDFRHAGGRLGEPAAGTPIPLSTMEPLEYYVMAGHGNELHLRHGRDVLCGAFPASFRENGAGAHGFDCEAACPYGERVPAAALPVHSLIVLSCDVVTFDDGFVPPEYSFLLNLLNGLCGSVVAPFRHAMLNSELDVMADALVRSGRSLGQVAERLNSGATQGAGQDRPFVVLGDPDIVPAPAAAAAAIDLRLQPGANGVDVFCESGGSHVLEWQMPRTVAPAGDRCLVVEPGGERPLTGEVYCTFRETADKIGVTLVCSEPLPSERLRFRVAALGGRNGQDDQQEVARSLQQLERLSVVGVDASFLRAHAESLRTRVRALADKPRVVRSDTELHVLRHRDVVIRHLFADTRTAVLRKVLGLMAHEPLWVSHRYANSFSSVRRVAEDHGVERACPSCDNLTLIWMYEDWEHGSRGPSVCIRCGIVADTPFPPDLDVRFSPPLPVTELERHGSITLENLTERRLNVSTATQFNNWADVEISAGPLVESLVLEPRESRELAVHHRFERPVNDDILNLHTFVLTEGFDLYCFTQRMICMQHTTNQ